MDENLPTHYRFRDYLDEDGVHVVIDKFKAIKETPRGYWVESKNSWGWMTLAEKRKAKMVRFVLKDSAKRHCYPTVELAFSSFSIRKYRQMQRLRTQFEQAELVHSRLNDLKSHDVEEFESNGFLYRGVNLGHTPSTENIVFDF